MSEYDDLEASRAASRPIELYRFIGSFREYHYTSSDRAINFNGTRYYPVTVTRSQVKAGTQEDETLSMDLQIPFDTQVVLDYAYSQTPPKLTLEVYRQQNSGTKPWSVFWQGLVRGFTVSGREAKVQVPSIFSLALQGDIPNVYFQSPCNHTLYNERCTVSRAVNRFDSFLTGVNGTNLVINDAPAVDNDFAAGELVNMRTGERRLILSNVGMVISLGYPFVDAMPGDEIEMFRGCDHSFETCKAKFANGINFGGYKDIPADNPFEGTI